MLLHVFHVDMFMYRADQIHQTPKAALFGQVFFVLHVDHGSSGTGFATCSFPTV